MKTKVRAFGGLMVDLGNESTIELEAETRIGDLVSQLVKKTGSLRKGFLGRHDLAGSDLVVLVNSRNIDALDELETTLKDGDVAVFLPPMPSG